MRRSDGKGLPKKGTKARKLLTLLLSETGVTAKEAASLGACNTDKDLAGKLLALSAFKGWDIRRFVCPKERQPQSAKRAVIYKIVGRHYGNRYKSFVNFEE